MSVQQLAAYAGLRADYVRELERDAKPLLPEAGVRLMSALLDTPRDEAVAELAFTVVQQSLLATKDTLQ